jgi:hypothetical protein
MRALRDADAPKAESPRIISMLYESTTGLDRTGLRALIHGFPAANLPLGREGETDLQTDCRFPSSAQPVGSRRAA